MSQPFPLNPFFSGNYAPISFEADAFDLPLRGDLPKELAGTLYRNGPIHNLRHETRTITGSSATV